MCRFFQRSMFSPCVFLLLSVVSCTDGQRLDMLQRKAPHLLQLPKPVTPGWEEDLAPEDLAAFQESLQAFAEELTAIDTLALSPLKKEKYAKIKKALEQQIRWVRQLHSAPSLYNLPEKWRALLSNPEFSQREIEAILNKELPQAGPYYLRARRKLIAPARDQCRLAMEQHIPGIAFLDTELLDFVSNAGFSEPEKTRLRKSLLTARLAMKEYIGWCNSQMLRQSENGTSGKIKQQH